MLPILLCVVSLGRSFKTPDVPVINKFNVKLSRDYMPATMVDETTYPIPKLQRLHRWRLGMDKEFHPTLYNGGDYSYPCQEKT